MSSYTVAFDVDGAVRSIECKSVESGNRFLVCRDDTSRNDNVAVAHVPFDAVAYILHESVDVSVLFGDGSGGVTAVPGRL